jgi:hypothetical protein
MVAALRQGCIRLEEVSTTCVSGWVNHSQAKHIGILCGVAWPPANAGGTDLLQVRFLFCEAKLPYIDPVL